MLIILTDEVLERDVYEVLLEFQAVTGCDQTGSLWTRKAKLLANIPLLPTFVIKAFHIKD